MFFLIENLNINALFYGNMSLNSLAGYGQRAIKLKFFVLNGI